MATQTNNLETLVIDNFSGQLTYFPLGDINSGLGDIRFNAGANPFLRPKSLTWCEKVYPIDAAGSVITDLIMDGKERVESGILYVYAIGHTGRLYKIQVNDPTTFNPDYDNPVLLTTLTVNTPTFTRGGFIDFYGATEKIYIGHDKGLTSINFDGTGEAEVGVLASWTQNVPRPLKQFTGVLYIGNGANIATVDSTATVTTYTKLSPGFPTGTQVRDIDFSREGTYLEMVVSRIALGDITSATQDTGITSSAESYLFKWNGVDAGITAFDYYPTFSLDANITFQNYQYIFGRDQFGMGIFDPKFKFTQAPEIPMVLPNAIGSSGNILIHSSPLYFLGELWYQMYAWGPFDHEIGANPTGYYGLAIHHATAPETDVVQVPFQKIISGNALGSSSNGYPGNQFGTSKVYFSTLETSSAPTIKYRLFKWRLITSPQVDGVVTPPTAEEAPVYATQVQLFSKKIQVKEVRIYADPWIANNSFTISLTDTLGDTISGSQRTFSTTDGTLVVGEDFCKYNPQMKPVYAVGLAFLNEGTTNHIINKVEIDYTSGGE